MYRSELHFENRFILGLNNCTVSCSNQENHFLCPYANEIRKKIFPFDLKYAKQTFQIMRGVSFNEREILLRPFKHFKRNKLKSCLDE
jgi:hypothetical protein